MRRSLPPFPALRAFEAAARLGSFRAAAEELCVTPSAISHQVRKLEEHLGCDLYDRSPCGPVLNQRGEAYLGRLTPLLDEIEVQTGKLFPARTPETIAIRGTPGFIGRWLIPRLDRLRERTGLEVRLSTGLPPTDFSAGNVDVIFHWGAEPVDGVVIEPFLATPKVAVASPEYLAKVGRPESPAELLGHKLLRDEVMDCWEEWLDRAGVAAPAGMTGQAFAHCELALIAAERAQGVALAYAALVQEDLATGRLVQLFPDRTDDKLIYSIAYPHSARRNRKILALRDWVMEEAHGSSPPFALAG
ncbi:LysR family transcriptional regulator [Rhodobacteraceae bacterium NNCM2]|nr:LysR family transcriptional regulator [Coraliihabitans acroporae]